MNRFIGEIVDRAAAARARASMHIAELRLSQPQVVLPEQVISEEDSFDLREADDLALLYMLPPRTQGAAHTSESATLL